VFTNLSSARVNIRVCRPIASGFTRRGLRHALFGVTLGVMLARLPAEALAQHNEWSLRQSLGAGLMISGDQIDRLEYDQVAVLGSVHGARAMLPWLALQAGLHAGRFFSSADPAGGLLALTLGVLLRVDREKLSPYVTVDLGPGRTDGLYRPYFAITAGFDARVTERLAMGPVFGRGQLVQWNGPTYSTDAQFLWFGISLRERHGEPPRPVQPKPPVVITRYERTEVVRHEHDPPGEDVLELIERALPSTHAKRVELLAPVLFDLASDRLEPTGIAMLHEVRRTLDTHPELERVEIEGYADQRGHLDDNLALSARRAERVRSWLVEHGIAAERLVVRAGGESELVESGTHEAAHEQNRRVVFRVVQQREAP
jgi:outer membrane protein OmpA-like peptidoglycan-associated protein